MQDKLGPGNSSDKELCFQNSFRELGQLLWLAKHCWKIADWSDWSYTSWSQRIANSYMACSGCQRRDCLVHGGILFRVVHAACLSTNNSNKRTLQHVLQSVQRPMTDLEMFSWGGVAQALQCLGLRGEAGPFDWMRTRCEAVTWNNSSGCTTQTKIKVEAISRIHDTWNDFHSCTRIMSVWPRSVLKSDM